MVRGISRMETLMRTFAAFLLTAAAALPADLPVREVVLYKHGVGYFERAGRLGPGESARLDFNASEMNDVLKSLTIEEKGGGKISGLRYDSQDPIGHKLADFPFKIGDDQPLSSVLGQLKGSRVELKFGNETVAGAIVGGRIVPGSDRQPEREQLTLLLDTGELRTVDLGAAAAIRFTDPKLQQQFKDYLAALVASRSKDKRSVYIDSTDSSARDVVASYLIPAAVWKSSYRLIFGSAAQPTLEGWAIVDNTTGEDWTKVKLSLVSGRPISFVSQLYAPKYVTRPEAELADDSAARPVVHTGAIGSGVGGGVGPAQPAARNFAMAAPAPAPVREEEPKPAFKSSIAADTVAREIGDLFEYRLAQPVTIRQNESAMLPFLQQPINARKLLIYSDHSSQHPTNAAELTNATGKTLDGGPITVYDGGGYAGEALMDTLKSSDKRLISYAVDLGTRITELYGSKQAIVREIHASRGILTVKVAAAETRTYTIRNVDQKAKTLVLEHPIRPEYTLLNQKPSEKTATNYRFEIALAPGAVQEFAVDEEHIYNQTYGITNLNSDAIVTYIQNRSLSAAARQQLQRIADQKSQIAGTDRELQQVETQTRDLNADEDRIRRNIQSLNAVSGQQQQVQNYARQIDQNEQRLAALRDRQAELTKQKASLQTELDRLVETLAF
jgi:hypothetical protein